MENKDTDKKTPNQGLFLESLVRNNKKIRDDRAKAIGNVAETTYRRVCEDLQMEITTMTLEREGMLDMSPTSADSLLLASDFKAPQYVAKDIELGIDIRECQVKLDVASKRYTELFGKKLAPNV